MLIIPEEARLFLEKYLPKYKEYKTRRELLIELYYLIEREGFAHSGGFYNSFGRKAQEIYDMIYEANQ